MFVHVPREFLEVVFAVLTVADVEDGVEFFEGEILSTILKLIRRNRVGIGAAVIIATPNSRQRERERRTFVSGSKK